MGKRLIKKLVTIAMALAVMVLTVIIESGIPVEIVSAKEEQVLLIQRNKVFEPGDEVTTSLDEVLTISFGKNGAVRLAPASSFSFVNESDDGYVFRLNSGRAWIENLFTYSHVNVLAGGSLLIPRKASFDVQVKGGVTELRVYRNQVLVGLVLPTYVPNKVQQSVNDAIINSYMVAEGSQSLISADKIVSNVEILKKLLYSKLIKEFQLSLFDRKVALADVWVTDNLKLDQELALQVEEQRRNSINSRNLKYTSLDSFGYQLDTTFRRLFDALTFVEARQIERLVNSLFDQLYDSEYLLLYGRTTEARQRLQIFKEMLTDQFLLENDDVMDLLVKKLWNAYVELNFVNPDHALYEVKTSLSRILLARLGHDAASLVMRLDLIRDYMNDAYALANTNMAAARVALQNYYDLFSGFLDAERSRLQGVGSLIAAENQLFDNLFRQYPQFYQDTFFAMKQVIETEWLKLLPEGPDKVEERQTIISTKIDFLKQLQQFFLTGKVGLNDARLITYRLISEIGDLQSSAQVGINELFAQRLKDYGAFLLFLNATNVAQLRGSTPQLQYDEFLSQQKEDISVEKALNVVLGQDQLTQPGITVNQIVAKVQQDFASEHISNVQLGTLSDITQTFVEIKSATDGDGVVFSGLYDWDKKLISRVQARGKMISESAVRLSMLMELLNQAFPVVSSQQQTQETQPVTQVVPELTKAEKVALSLLIQKLKANGITVDPKNVVISDLDKGSFVINGAILSNNKKIQFAFLYMTKQDQVSLLTIRTPAGDRRLNEAIQLSEVQDAVAQAYDGGVSDAKTTTQ